MVGHKGVILLLIRIIPLVDPKFFLTLPEGKGDRLIFLKPFKVPGDPFAFFDAEHPRMGSDGIFAGERRFLSVCKNPVYGKEAFGRDLHGNPFAYREQVILPVSEPCKVSAAKIGIGEDGQLPPDPLPESLLFFIACGGKFIHGLLQKHDVIKLIAVCAKQYPVGHGRCKSAVKANQVFHERGLSIPCLCHQKLCFKFQFRVFFIQGADLIADPKIDFAKPRQPCNHTV